jgi:hypothetical protein
MQWTVEAKRNRAVSDHGYRLTWVTHPGTTKPWVNAWTPATARHEGMCIAAGFDMKLCKAACDKHLARKSETT